jgi:hypothetical protein
MASPIKRMCVKNLLTDIGRIIIFDKWMINYYEPKCKVMKALNLIGWISGGIGVLIILLGFISGIIGKSILPIQHIGTYFQIANSFFLITIALFIVVNRCECNKK